MPGTIMRAGTIVSAMSVVYSETHKNEIYAPYKEMYKLIKRVEALEKQLENLSQKS